MTNSCPQPCQQKPGLKMGLSRKDLAKQISHEWMSVTHMGGPQSSSEFCPQDESYTDPHKYLIVMI